MPSMSSGINYVAKTQLPNNTMATDTGISLSSKQEGSGSNIDSDINSDKLSLSDRAKSLYWEYTNREEMIKNQYKSAKHRLEAEYAQKKQKLEAEYQREQQALGINIYA